MKTLIIVALGLSLIGCGKSSDSGSYAEVEYEKPDYFVGTLDSKEFNVSVVTPYGISPIGMDGGIGINTRLSADDLVCILNTDLESTGTNKYELIVSAQTNFTEGAAKFFGANDPSCDSLIGTYSIRHNGKDPATENNAEITKIE